MPYCMWSQNDSTVYMGIGSYYVFYSDSTYRLVNIPCDICPPYADNNNLISYGTYISYKDSAFLLTSSPLINPYYLMLEVEEHHADSNIISILLDVPANKDKDNMLSPHYFYAIEISFLKYSSPIDSNKCTHHEIVDLYHQEYFQNSPSFQISCDTLCYPMKIKVTIYPKEKSSVSFAQGVYRIQDLTSNNYVIHIPQFITGFLNYQRMSNFVIERFDNGFIGDGIRTFVRKDIYERENYSNWNFPVCPNWRYKVP